MRNELDKILTGIATFDKSLCIVVSDLGSFRLFRDSHPDRFINVGVSEQNSVGIAAGLASEGKRVILFGVSGFTIYRGFEQIKFSIGYWKQPVIVVGTGFGWNFYRIGRGHHSPDDIALMSLIPNMKIFAPIDASSLPDIIEKSKGNPSYIRLGLGIESTIYEKIPRTGSDLQVIALGEMAKRVSSAVNKLYKMGIKIGLLGIEELSIAEIRQLLNKYGSKAKRIVIEDHIKLGGLGMMIMEAGYHIDHHLYLPINVEEVTTTENELLEYYGFDEVSLINLFMKYI